MYGITTVAFSGSSDELGRGLHLGHHGPREKDEWSPLGLYAVWSHLLVSLPTVEEFGREGPRSLWSPQSSQTRDPSPAYRVLCQLSYIRPVKASGHHPLTLNRQIPFTCQEFV